MKNDEIVVIVDEIISLLTEAGHAPRSRWLEERRAVLRDPTATPDGQEHARKELHGVVLGMGGLMDLRLLVAPGSSCSTAAARTRLDSLADRLYVLTK